MTGPLDKKIEVNGICFDALGWFPFSTRKGIMLTAQLVDGEYTANQVRDALVGQQIEGYEIRGVEMKAVHGQTDAKIGILI